MVRHERFLNIALVYSINSVGAYWSISSSFRYSYIVKDRNGIIEIKLVSIVVVIKHLNDFVVRIPEEGASISWSNLEDISLNKS